MANKNIQIKSRNGNAWDNLYPISLDTNIFSPEGKSVTTQLDAANRNITATPFISSTTVFVNHRGLNRMAPENTIPAIDLAGQYGATMVEVDVRGTSDGKLVLMHDNTVDRMTNGTGTVASKTLAQIKALSIDSGNRVSSYPETKVPTFEEYLLICKKWGIRPFVHLYDEAFLPQVVELLKKYGLDNKCLLGISLAKTKELRAGGNQIIRVVVGGRTAQNIHEMDGIPNVIAGTMSVTAADAQIIHNAGYALSDYNDQNDSKWRTANKDGIDYYLVDGVIEGGDF